MGNRRLPTMARRYDSRTTIFSPEGRLYQVEYVMEAIGHAGAAIGILGTDGVVLAAEKKTTSKLLESDKTSEKMYMVDEHIACAVAGIRADANILINNARLSAQRHLFKYDEPMPVEQLIQSICDLKQGYTSLEECGHLVFLSCSRVTTSTLGSSCIRVIPLGTTEGGKPRRSVQITPRLSPS